MRYLLAVACLALPVAAQAQDKIPDPYVQTSFDECTVGCNDAGHSFAFCTEVCGCMMGEMSRYWDMNDLQARMDRLRANPEDEQVKAEMSKLASYCAKRVAE